MINNKLLLLPLISLLCFSCKNSSGNLSEKEAREWIKEHYKNDATLKTKSIVVDIKGTAEKPENVVYLKSTVFLLFGYILDDNLTYHEENSDPQKQEEMPPLNVEYFDKMSGKDKMKFKVNEDRFTTVMTIASKEKNGYIATNYNSSGYIDKVDFFYDLIEGFDGPATITATRTFTF